MVLCTLIDEGMNNNMLLKVNQHIYINQWYIVPAIPAHLQCFHKHFTCLLVHVLRAPIAEID